ncbi:hypothetical protein DN068_17135 [Taibaiella soli]|uniref:Secretion system C-terminal sorting domain-containing protein n=2 Tax=Taibaiella soli TaxID=1649169 RepID=A0A2W2B6F6_9BACT|nr:hypothetical protein DN068_17135 [Taibaiella soli]
MTATAQYHFYFGNIHSHTAYSDGTQDNLNATPATAYQYAKQSYHMDFLGVAEHNHFTSTHNPGMHVADYANGSYQADTANHNGTFVSMFGMEYGVINNGGHVIIYGMPGLIGWESGSGGWGTGNNYTFYNSEYNYQTLWTLINQHAGAFATLAHPQSTDYDSLLEHNYNISADSAVVGCAIRSGSAFSTTTNYSDAPATLYQSKYFLALSKGFHLGPTIDHDNHNTTFGRTNCSRTVIIAQALNRDSIMKAYRDRHFYASDDWDAEVTFTVNNRLMGTIDTINANPQISVSISDPGNASGGSDPTQKIELYYGKARSGAVPTILTTTTGSNTLSYTHSINVADSFYYFAKITQTDGDIIWTSPIWIKKTIGTTPPPTAVNQPLFAHTEKLLLYPNPAMHTINTSINLDAAATATIKIYDASGHEVMLQTQLLNAGTNTISLNIDQLNTGVYFFVMTNGSGRIGQAIFTVY